MWPGTQYKRRGAAAGESDLWLTSLSISESGICFPDIFFSRTSWPSTLPRSWKLRGANSRNETESDSVTPRLGKECSGKKCKERFLWVNLNSSRVGVERESEISKLIEALEVRLGARGHFYFISSHIHDNPTHFFLPAKPPSNARIYSTDDVQRFSIQVVFRSRSSCPSIFMARFNALMTTVKKGKSITKSIIRWPYFNLTTESS